MLVAPNTILLCCGHPSINNANTSCFHVTIATSHIAHTTCVDHMVKWLIIIHSTISDAIKDNPCLLHRCHGGGGIGIGTASLCGWFAVGAAAPRYECTYKT